VISFDYLAAPDLETAVRAGAAASTRFVAGGTTLIDLMKLGVERPTHVVDLNPLVSHDASLAAISELPGGGLRLGALAHMSDVAWDARVRDRYPLVSQSLLLAASGQVRNMATMAGNILQRTRCQYFRDTATACNKREPGSGCAALHGINRGHAILGTSDRCIATHPSDLAVALTALDAVVHARGPNGMRTIPVGEFRLLPGAHPERETALHPGDVITAIDLPPLPLARRSMYLKVRDRASFAFALAAAAVALDVQSGTIRGARVALGGVGTKPWRSHEAEHALIGRPATLATYRAAADAALAAAHPQTHNRFKIELAKRTLTRALTEVSA
jgi:Aerobic-type carbon monoxide dehydrogenase, middle subunit CoxM/CutM homologs